jgi:hypothetical protein
MNPPPFDLARRKRTIALQQVPMRRGLLFSFSALTLLATGASFFACHADDSAAVPSIPAAEPVPAREDASTADSASAADAAGDASADAADAPNAADASDASDAADVSVPADG